MQTCEICETEIRDDEAIYFDDINEEYLCEDCYIQLLAKRQGLI